MAVIITGSDDAERETAMQRLATLAVTAKEAGGLKWAGIQLAWMCGVAYLAALIVYQVLS
jgi:ferrous iron transport protein B